MYDNNGNLTTDPTTGNGYVYDAWNRLVAVTNGGTTLAGYQYDALGRRVAVTESGTTTDLYYNSQWQVIEERVNGQTQVQYVWSPLGVDKLVERDSNPDGNGNLTLRLYVQQDANGNVTALTDTSGNVVERYETSPYGTVTVLNPDFTVRGTSSYNWQLFWQGKFYDSQAGLYDSRGRVFSPSLMRTLQADPLGLGPDINDFRWEGDDPVDRMDPSGMNIYYLYDPKVITGPSGSKGGHSALLIGDPDYGYYYFSFSPALDATEDTPAVGTLKSHYFPPGTDLDEIFEATLTFGKDKDIMARYKAHNVEIETNLKTDLKAIAEAKKWRGKGFSAVANNCTDFTIGVIIASGAKTKRLPRQGTSGDVARPSLFYRWLKEGFKPATTWDARLYEYLTGNESPEVDVGF